MQNEKQRERLVELLNEATFGVNTQTLADHLKKETIEKVADYLIANNVVVLPCKVGDTVYVTIGRLLPHIAECKVIAVTHHIFSLEDYRKAFSFSVVAKNSKTPNTFIDTDIGKRVFFSREEAEKALAERSKK